MVDRKIANQILFELGKKFNNAKALNEFMSTPCKEFKNRTPYDMLIMGEYELFSRYIGNENTTSNN